MPRSICSIEGCETQISGQGLCAKHRYRLKKYGSPHICPRGHAPPEVRFWRKVEKSDGCWMWTGTKSAEGYGKFQAGSKKDQPAPIGAHRFSYEMAKGPIPDGRVVMHSCDNPSCVNPAHLSVGTHRENALDMIRKGRGNHKGALGEQNAAAILTEEKVRYIRASPLRNLDLARELEVNPVAISRVRRGRTWKHVV